MSGSIILGIVGIILVVLGYLIWKKQKISLLHSYHYDKVQAEDKKAFCTISGIGIVIIGMGILLTAVVVDRIHSMWSFIPFAIGFVSGLIMLIYAGIRYNHS